MDIGSVIVYTSVILLALLGLICLGYSIYLKIKNWH